MRELLSCDDKDDCCDSISNIENYRSSLQTPLLGNGGEDALAFPLVQTVLRMEDEEESESSLSHHPPHTTSSCSLLPPTTTCTTPRHGKVQPPKFRDAWCAVAFYLQLATVVCLAIWLGPLIGTSSSSSSSYTTTTPHAIAAAAASTTTTTTIHTAHATDRSPFLSGSSTSVLVLVTELLVLPVACAMLSTLLYYYGLLAHYSKFMIQVSFWATPVMLGGLALVATMVRILFINSSTTKNDTTVDGVVVSRQEVASLWCGTVLWMVVAGCHYWEYRKSIPYCTANVQVALRALTPYRTGGNRHDGATGHGPVVGHGRFGLGWDSSLLCTNDSSVHGQQ
jgi:hypothetical protein